MVTALIAGEIGGGHMESMVWVYLSGVIFSIIALSGAIICIRGFKKSRRYLFAYAAIYFSASVIATAIFLALQVSGLFSNPDYFMVTDYFILARGYILPLTLVLMIWGFFRESHA
jgi:hypothetical protein